MAGIFISYRQADAAAWAMTLHDELVRVFGKDQVFLDKDTLHAGNWREQINQALDRCSVVLIVIGSRWLTTVDTQGQPRLNLPDDVHHQEIVLALSRPTVTVIPVLVEETPMPLIDQLPQDLHRLCDQQAYKIGDTPARRKADLEVLIENIQTVGGLERLTESANSTDDKIPDKSRSWLSLGINVPGWLKLDITVLGIAFVLTVCSSMLAFLSNEAFANEELLVLLVLFYLLTFGVKRLWHTYVGCRRKESA